jgi:hypothetical protein
VFYTTWFIVLAHLKKVCYGYFSDGASSLYNNCKIFLNLYYEDFHIAVKWNVFAAVHVKKHCDEIGGTVKELVLCPNFQATKRECI